MYTNRTLYFELYLNFNSCTKFDLNLTDCKFYGFTLIFEYLNFIYLSMSIFYPIKFT